MYPELNGLLSGNTDEILNNMDAIREHVKTSTAQMKVEAQRDRIIELTKEQYAAEEQLAENEAQRKKILEGLTDEQKENLKQVGNMTKSAFALDETTRTAAASLKELYEADETLRCV